MRFHPLYYFGATAALLAGGLAVGIASDTGAGTGPPGLRMHDSSPTYRMLEAHRRMLAQMQTDVSPAMIALMENDPMWRMMRTPAWADLDAAHQSEIDRMLGR